MPTPSQACPNLGRAVRRQLRRAKYHGAAHMVVVLWCLPALWIVRTASY